jgi:hypothetical protein
MKNTKSQIEGIKSQTIGVEVEMNSIKRSEAAKVAADLLRNRTIQEHRRPTTATTPGAPGTTRTANGNSRGTFPSADRTEKCELVTPILHYNDIEPCRSSSESFGTREQERRQNAAAAVHIHIGAQGHTPQSLRNLANIMASHEQLLIRALGLDPQPTSRYCRTVDPDFLPPSTRRSRRRWQALRTSGTPPRELPTAGTSITTTAATTC